MASATQVSWDVLCDRHDDQRQRAPPDDEDSC